MKTKAKVASEGRKCRMYDTKWPSEAEIAQCITHLGRRVVPYPDPTHGTGGGTAALSFGAYVYTYCIHIVFIYIYKYIHTEVY